MTNPLDHAQSLFVFHQDAGALRGYDGSCFGQTVFEGSLPPNQLHPLRLYRLGGKTVLFRSPRSLDPWDGVMHCVSSAGKNLSKQRLSKSPKSPKVLDLAVYGPHFAVILTQEGLILQTTDGGEQWVSLLSPLVDTWEAKFKGLDTVDGCRMYARTEDCVFVSGDAGRNWEQCFKAPKSNPRIEFVGVCGEGAAVVVALAPLAWHISTDGGQLWSAIDMQHVYWQREGLLALNSQKVFCWTSGNWEFLADFVGSLGRMDRLRMASSFTSPPLILAHDGFANPRMWDGRQWIDLPGRRAVLLGWVQEVTSTSTAATTTATPTAANPSSSSSSSVLPSTHHGIGVGSSGSSGSSGSRGFSDSLSCHFARLRTAEKFADCILEVGAQRIPAHRAILSRSPVWEAALTQPTAHQLVDQDVSTADSCASPPTVTLDSTHAPTSSCSTCMRRKLGCWIPGGLIFTL
eukprot:NODE_354_length_1744_cov_334.228909_g287_i0.p1 GENE.NODE_354_length_1744_cov_334.228909_g287_i0~~NODE_354_length_1744_cov_334.228909_g287_i0.p1  ORF type:complete len:460 (-),score=81.25 NODE_354_length_1744_cov_334.228909_g287_i0:256-1635(-)